MLQKIILISIGLTFALLSAGCAYPLSYSEPVSVDGQPVKIVLPMTMDPTPFKDLEENTYKLLSPCTIETRQGSCLFDTGAFGLIINSCLAETTSRFVGVGQGSVGGSGEFHQQPTRKIKRLVVAGRTE